MRGKSNRPCFSCCSFGWPSAMAVSADAPAANMQRRGLRSAQDNHRGFCFRDQSPSAEPRVSGSQDCLGYRKCIAQIL